MKEIDISTITDKEKKIESFEIIQDENIYKLNIEIINKDLILNISDKKDILTEYVKKLTLEELKSLHKIFIPMNSFQEFIDIIKILIDNNKLSIKYTNNNELFMELTIEYLYKQNIIKIYFCRKQVKLDLIAQDLYSKFSDLFEENKNLKHEINNLKEENKVIKAEDIKIKNKINNIKEKNINSTTECNENLILQEKINSVIIENQNELDMVKLPIEKTMNKKIKEIKKLYQATKDGGDPSTFHKICDNIPNTLILYKSADNRRFGGYASECWKESYDFIEDKNSFLFSLDKKKIYPPKNHNYYSIECSSDFGPGFSGMEFTCFRLLGNALKNPCLKTYESKNEEIFDGNKNALSEDGNYKGLYAKEYEVFEIKF